jgi:hypothetical protein
MEAERAVRKQGAEDFFNAEDKERAAVWNKPEAPFIFYHFQRFMSQSSQADKNSIQDSHLYLKYSS